MEKVEKLEGRVDYIEKSKLPTLNEDVMDIKLKLERNNLLTEQNVETNAKLSDTLDVVTKTMIQMSESMKASDKEVAKNMKETNKVSRELSLNVKELGNKFDGFEHSTRNDFIKVDEKMAEFDKKIACQNIKEKYRFAEFLKCNWKTVSGTLVLFGVVVYEVLGKIGIF